MCTHIFVFKVRFATRSKSLRDPEKQADQIHSLTLIKKVAKLLPDFVVSVVVDQILLQSSADLFVLRGGNGPLTLYETKQGQESDSFAYKKIGPSDYKATKQLNG